MNSPVCAFLILTLAGLAHAGPGEGGGGDASEMHVSEIRSDLLGWINSAEAKTLKLPTGTDFATYRSSMQKILTAHAVIVGFVTGTQETKTTNPELKVSVDGQPKTCRGFLAKSTRQPHILCNVERFNETAAAAQYKLIHHEYAGLAGVEQNRGASSDYQISSQIAQHLTSQTVFKLAISGKTVTIEGPIAKNIYQAAATLELGGSSGMGRGDVDLSGVVCQKIADKDSNGTGEICHIGADNQDDSKRNLTFDASNAENHPQDEKLKTLERNLADFRLALEDAVKPKMLKTANGLAKTTRLKRLKCHTAGIGHEYDDIQNEMPYTCILEKE
jgi:hypothetical protein